MPPSPTATATTFDEKQIQLSQSSRDPLWVREPSTTVGDEEKGRYAKDSVDDEINGGLREYAKNGSISGYGEEDAVERQASLQPCVNDVESIPNGGLAAWLQVLGAFFLFFNSWYVFQPQFCDGFFLPDRFLAKHHFDIYEIQKLIIHQGCCQFVWQLSGILRNQFTHHIYTFRHILDWIHPSVSFTHSRCFVWTDIRCSQ